MAKQKLDEHRGRFNPYSYFGALDMPEIPHESEPADWRIQRIFKQSFSQVTQRTAASGEAPSYNSSAKTKNKLTSACQLKITPSMAVTKTYKVAH